MNKENILQINYHTETINEIEVQFVEPLEDGTLFWILPSTNDSSDQWAIIQEWLDDGNSIGDLYAQIRANRYKEYREKEYPSYGEQLDYIYHNGVDAWKADMIDPIKNKYPKPE